MWLWQLSRVVLHNLHLVKWSNGAVSSRTWKGFISEETWSPKHHLTSWIKLWWTSERERDRIKKSQGNCTSGWLFWFSVLQVRSRASSPKLVLSFCSDYSSVKLVFVRSADGQSAIAQYSKPSKWASKWLWALEESNPLASLNISLGFLNLSYFLNKLSGITLSLSFVRDWCATVENGRRCSRNRMAVVQRKKSRKPWLCSQQQVGCCCGRCVYD